MKEMSFILTNNNHFRVCVCVCVGVCVCVCSRTTDCRAVSILVERILHSIAADGGKCPFSRQDKEKGLVDTKSIFTLQDQGHFC